MRERITPMMPDADYRIDGERPDYLSESLATEEGLSIITEEDLAAQVRDNRLVRLGCA